MKKMTRYGLMLLMLAAPAWATAEPAKESDDTMLPGSDVLGNRELPVGLDIVPWRPSAAGEVKEGPTQLLDVPLTPIDPVVFRRELEIYQSSQKP
jgi:hypothetical protein